MNTSKINQEKEEFFKIELSDKRQRWRPDLGLPMRPADKLFAEILKPAGRYRCPLPFGDILLLRLYHKIATLCGFGAAVFPEDTTPVPLNWQTIVQYLFEAGIIKEPKVDFEISFNDEPKLYLLRLWATSVSGLTDGGADLMGGGYNRGVSADLDEAISKAIGELLERYPLALYRDSELVRASVADLKRSKAHFLDPFFVAGYSDFQKKEFSNRRFDDRSIFRWAEGASLMSGGKALIPAQMVFWNYLFDKSEPFLQQPITSGAGGMFTLTEAILSGLHELVQRDGFFIYWLNKIAPPRINHSSIKSPELLDLLEALRRYGLRVEILDVTSDLGIPAFASIIIDGDGAPAIAMGAGCGFDPEAAILRAVTEAIGVRHWLRAIAETSGYFSLPTPYKPFSVRLGQKERLLLWGNPNMRENLDFFLDGPIGSIEKRHPAPEVFSSPEEELRHMVNIFKKKGERYEIFFFEAKHPVLEKLGYKSVRVSVPALIPLYLNELAAPLGAERRVDACGLLGYNPAKEINDLPHPFP